MKTSTDMTLKDWVKFALWLLIPFLIIAWALGSSKRYAFAEKFAQGQLIVLLLFSALYVSGVGLIFGAATMFHAF